MKMINSLVRYLLYLHRQKLLEESPIMSSDLGILDFKRWPHSLALCSPTWIRCPWNIFSFEFNLAPVHVTKTFRAYEIKFFVPSQFWILTVAFSFRFSLALSLASLTGMTSKTAISLGYRVSASAFFGHKFRRPPFSMVQILFPVLSDVENFIIINFYCTKRFAIKFQRESLKRILTGKLKRNC